METRTVCGVTVTLGDSDYSDYVRAYLAHADDTDPRTLAALIESGAVFVPKTLFDDDNHPFAVSAGGVLAETVRNEITQNIRGAMRFKGYTLSKLAAFIPRADGAETCYTARQIGNLINSPEKLNAEQVQALNFVLHVTTDYLRGTVDYPDKTTRYGSKEDLKRVYGLLDDSSRETLWSVALALLAQNSPNDYADYMSLLSMPNCWNLSPLIDAESDQTTD